MFSRSTARLSPEDLEAQRRIFEVPAPPAPAPPAPAAPAVALEEDFEIKTFYKLDDARLYAQGKKAHVFQMVGDTIHHFKVIPRSKILETLSQDNHLGDVHMDDEAFLHADIDISNNEKDALAFQMLEAMPQRQIVREVELLIKQLRDAFSIPEEHQAVVLEACAPQKKFSYHVHFPTVLVSGFYSIKAAMQAIKDAPKGSALRFGLDNCVFARQHVLRSQGQSKDAKDGKQRPPLRFLWSSDGKQPQGFYSRTFVYEDDLDRNDIFVIRGDRQEAKGKGKKGTRNVCARNIPKDDPLIEALHASMNIEVQLFLKNYQPQSMTTRDNANTYRFSNTGSEVWKCGCGEQHGSNGVYVVQDLLQVRIICAKTGRSRIMTLA